MGAWGSGSFENDDALDWLDQLEGGDVGVFVEAFDAAGSEYLDAPDASMILAAAEIVAASGGHPPATELPEDALTYLASRPDLSDQRVAAQAAVARVLAEGSELDELWKDSEEYASWRSAVVELQTRLAR